ncbi:MAG: hypothetical protein ACK5PS_05930 [Desulfopila sp.]
MRIWITPMLCGLCLLMAMAHQSLAFVVDGYTTLVAEDAGSNDQYGFSMATDGRWLVVGAKNATVDGLQSGAVYVYVRDGHHSDWRLVQKLVPDNGDAISPAEFGESVAVSHNRILVGARAMRNQAGQQSGVAFLYTYKGQRRGWVLDAQLQPADGQDGDEFGRAVDLGPGQAFVGARFAASDNGVRAGAVYVFQRNGHGWRLQKKLTDPHGNDHDQFGRTLSFDHKSQNFLVVGSRKASDLVGDQGKALIFRNRGADWQLWQELEAFDGRDGDYFGQSVALAGNLLVVGARNSFTTDGIGVGGAYIYRLSTTGTWAFSQKLMPDVLQNNGQYGFAVAIDRLSGSSLAVGARRMDSVLDKKTGQVYLYSLDTTANAWQLDDIVIAADAAPGDEFGQSLAMDPFGGHWLAVGADQVEVDGAQEAGAVYVLQRLKPAPAREDKKR